MHTVLILDDDKLQLDHLATLLKENFAIQTASTPISAYKLINTNKFDAIIVDVHMPIIDGFEFIKSIKEEKNIKSSLFILSSDNSLNTKIKALNLGIKDFLSPCMAKEEIVPRIRNHITISKDSTNYQYNDIKINTSNLSAYIFDKKLNLTLIEFKILSYLVQYGGKVLLRSALKEFVWPMEHVSDKTLNTHLTNLRLKFNEYNVEIKSIKGEGIILA